MGIAGDSSAGKFSDSPAGEATDVLEDFLTSEPGATHPKVESVTVPSGATHLFIAVPDERYMDNSDPDNDLNVMILAEPGIPALSGTGAIAGLALAERRRRRAPRI